MAFNEWIFALYVASGFASIPYYFLLPKRFKKGLRVFVWLLAFSIVLTPVSILLAFFQQIALRKQEKTPHLKNLEVDESRIPKYSKRLLGESAVHNPNERLVYYLMNTEKPYSFRILKRFLNSDNDELRLLSFTYLERKEKQMIRLIKNYMGFVKENPKVLYKVGKLYWEAVYLSITDKELEGIYIEMALRYLLEYLGYYGEDEQANFLVGRIYHRKGDFEEAVKFYEKSLKYGFPMERVLPYYVECLFKLKRFKEIYDLRKRVGKLPLTGDLKANFYIRVWFQ